jgi:hypothetical protein
MMQEYGSKFRPVTLALSFADTRVVRWKPTDIAEEYVAPIFRVEE